MDLSRWSRDNYRVSFFGGLLLHLGANPYRCDYCRVNFISFRRRKERYSPQKRKAERKRSHGPEGEHRELAGQPGPGEST
jgi:hypothetical protein